jgi:glycosyltransferase involved in cell wall biosynthesis
MKQFVLTEDEAYLIHKYRTSGKILDFLSIEGRKIWEILQKLEIRPANQRLLKKFLSKREKENGSTK